MVSVTASLTLIPYAETLLAKSQELISRNEFNIGAVVAQMACEIAAERAISRAFVSRGLEYLEDAVSSFLFGYNLATKRNRNLYNALTGREIQNQPESADRRNAAVHRGASVRSSRRRRHIARRAHWGTI
jgi:hypothetical protein